MSSISSPFPWHYYIKTVQSRLILIILTVLLSFLANALHPHQILQNAIGILLIMTFLTFIFAIFRIRPFVKLLGRLEKLQIKLPHDKKLDLIYQKNEWNLIQEVISITEKYLDEQDENIKNQTIQSDTMIESIPSEIVIIDTFQNCKRYNSQFKTKFISTKKTRVLETEKLWKIFDNQDILKAFTEVVQQDQCIKLPAVHFKETNEYFDIAITPLHDAKMKVYGALGIFHNVTASKLTDKMRVDFVANVSHEIRTPLTSIKGYSQLLAAQMQNLSEDQEMVVGKIISNTERLKDLFENLLNLSTIESQFNVTKENILVDELVQRVEIGLKGKYLKKPFIIEKNFDSETLFGDFKLLEQVFTNLIDNAIKYATKAPVIKISTNDSPTHTIIQIQDNGPGINENELNRIFERFYRVQGNRTDTIEGTGLGLSIVKHIINKHRGEIKVESIVAEGTTFTIKLPK